MVLYPSFTRHLSGDGFFDTAGYLPQMCGYDPKTIENSPAFENDFSCTHEKGRNSSPALRGEVMSMRLLSAGLRELQPDVETDSAHILAGEVCDFNILIVRINAADKPVAYAGNQCDTLAQVNLGIDAGFGHHETFTGNIPEVV